jgi:hypothetical protein
MMVIEFLRSPISALRFIPRHCGVLVSTPHSSGLNRYVRRKDDNRFVVRSLTLAVAAREP